MLIEHPPTPVFSTFRACLQMRLRKANQTVMLYNFVHGQPGQQVSCHMSRHTGELEDRTDMLENLTMMRAAHLSQTGFRSSLILTPLEQEGSASPL